MHHGSNSRYLDRNHAGILILWDRLFRLKEQGVTLIVTTHFMDEAEQLCSRLVVMDRGQIVEVGNHDELLAREGAYYKLYQAQARNVDADTDMTSDGERVDAAEPAYAQ